MKIRMFFVLASAAVLLTPVGSAPAVAAPKGTAPKGTAPKGTAPKGMAKAPYSKAQLALYKAIKAAKPADVRKALDAGASANQLDSEGNPPLVQACPTQIGFQEEIPFNVKILEILLDHGADPNLQSKDGRSPLSQAVSQHYQSAIELLLKRGADPNKGAPEWLSLGFAVGSGDMSLVHDLVDAGAKLPVGPAGEKILCNLIEGSRYRLLGSEARYLKELQFIAGHPAAPLEWKQMGQVLLTAIQNENLPVVKYLLEQGVPANVKFRDADIALAQAIRQQNIKLAEDLLKAGANHRATLYGETALGQAINLSNTNIAWELMKAGADPKMALKTEPGLLLAAIAGRDDAAENVVKALLDAGAPADGDPLDTENSPAANAALAGKPRIALLLLHHGANPNRMTHGAHGYDMDKMSLLMAALVGGNEHLEMARWLKPIAPAEKLSEVNRVVEAQRQDLRDLVKELLSKGVDVRTGTNRFCLVPAAGGGDLEIMRMLLANGAPVNPTQSLSEVPGLRRSNSGETPLISAASSGQAEAVELLLEKGADARAVDGGGKTALISVVDMGNSTMVAFSTTLFSILTMAPAPPDTAASKAAALAGAAEEDLKIVRALLKAGTPVNARDADGKTALMAAMRTGGPSVIGALLDAGADPNVRDANGDTALMLLLTAAHRGMNSAFLDDGSIKESAQILRANGGSPAEVEAVTTKGKEARTASLKAAVEQDVAIINLLLSHGAQRELKNKSGQTALQVAEALKYPEAAAALQASVNPKIAPK